MRILVAMLILLSPAYASPQASNSKGPVNPYECLDTSAVRGEGLKAIRTRVRDMLDRNPQDALSLCKVAELMKKTGDSRAREYYEKAIRAAPGEPAYELFLADYLRNFRGARHPLFPEAEHHYYEGLRKFNELGSKQAVDEETGRRIERGLVALYQEDGLPVLHWKSNPVSAGDSIERPFMFFSTINRYAQSTTDVDRIDDVRGFTSEALFSSTLRANQPLSRLELERMARTKATVETSSHFRFRYKGAPALEAFYGFRNVRDAKITDFSNPTEFNDVSLHEYGVAVERSINLYPYFDTFLRGSFKRIKREGLIDRSPQTNDHVDQFEFHAAVSRFVGPDKANFEFAYVRQGIEEQTQTRSRRDREIIAGTFTYQLFRPIAVLQSVYENRFETRGIDLFGGILHDRESFGPVDVKRDDYFVGAAFKGLGAFDVTVQPTLFTQNVEGDAFQNSSQYRTNLAVLYRVIDEEKHPAIPEGGGIFHTAFLHLVFPFKHDVAIDGIKDFENYRVGVGLDGKFFTTGARKTTFLASVRYDFIRFHRLDKNRNLLGFSLSMGF